MAVMYLKKVERPAFTSVGCSFITKPIFTSVDGLSMFFDWEIKCFRHLPDFSLSFEKITQGQGNFVADYSHNFVLPDRMYFVGINAVSPRKSAYLQLHCAVKLLKSSEVPFGLFRLLILLEVLGEEFEITQNFQLVKRSVKS